MLNRKEFDYVLEQTDHGVGEVGGDQPGGLQGNALRSSLKTTPKISEECKMVSQK